MKKITFLSALIALCGNLAHANWDVQNSGEDVFGNVNVTATSVGDNGNLIRFECGSSSQPFFVFLLRDNAGEVPAIPARFLHVDQDGERSEVEAQLVPWNEQYVAIQVTNSDMLERIVEHMIVATGSVSVGITIPGFDIRVADTFSSRGSTAAGRVLEQHCLTN